MTETLAGDEHFSSDHKLVLCGGSEVTVVLVLSQKSRNYNLCSKFVSVLVIRC